MTWQEKLNRGVVIPACPLALQDDRTWSEQHQEGLARYYVESGAGGVAVGVHTTQFAVRDDKYGLFEPVLRLMSESLVDLNPEAVRVAGICGPTEQAVAEAKTASRLNYHAGLLALSALKDATEDELIDHCERVSDAIPVFGFYLHPGVGGRLLSYTFWRRFCELPNVVAIKIAAFNRYQTWDVIRAVIESGRSDIAIYTGNDDNIIGDLLTPFSYEGITRYVAGGLLGQWAVWSRSAVKMLADIQAIRQQDSVPAEWLQKNVELTDANAAIFDAANGFSGCIPGVNEVLRRDGLLPTTLCLDPNEVLGPGQSEEITRVTTAYPHLTDGLSES